MEIVLTGELIHVVPNKQTFLFYFWSNGLSVGNKLSLSGRPHDTEGVSVVTTDFVNSLSLLRY